MTADGIATDKTPDRMSVVQKLGRNDTNFLKKECQKKCEYLKYEKCGGGGGGEGLRRTPTDRLFGQVVHRDAKCLGFKKFIKCVLSEDVAGSAPSLALVARTRGGTLVASNTFGPMGRKVNKGRPWSQTAGMTENTPGPVLAARH